MNRATSAFCWSPSKLASLGILGDGFVPAGFGKGGFDFQESVIGIEPSRGKRAGDPSGSVGAHLPVGFGEPCPFLETVRVSGPSGGPLAQPVEVDHCKGIGLKNCRDVEVEKFYRLCEKINHLVEASFEVIAMCRGGAIAGNPEDALTVEMRIEGGEVLDCPCNLADQVENSPFFLPGIAKQARQEPGLGGKFGPQRLACEQASTKARRSAGRFGKGIDKRLASERPASR